MPTIKEIISTHLPESDAPYISSWKWHKIAQEIIEEIEKMGTITEDEISGRMGYFIDMDNWQQFKKDNGVE